MVAGNRGDQQFFRRHPPLQLPFPQQSSARCTEFGNTPKPAPQIAVIASIAGCAPTTSYLIARKFSGTAFCAVETRPVARISIHILSPLNSFVRNN